ncbi:unnamed protein product [Mytilus edulis]|uniref:Uncharacterized protein n=1 Tax=Mytilus edulis TaxID=6550 RepID=A0A8S3Q4K5_MYTED|nr:unnamed protein product [Mytilus edulis]
MESGFNPEKVQVRQEPAWVTLGGETPSLTTHVPSAEEVLNGACGVHFDSGTFPLRDPDLFLSGQIHHHLSNWKDILVGTDDKDILKWLINGVDATDFFRYFKGNFKGRFYDSDIPPNQYFQNSKICKQHVDFISKELCEKIAMGSVKLLGAVGECEPPRIVMPLTVEPSKPRLCHDERFLNLWVKDLPFHLETLKDILD